RLRFFFQAEDGIRDRNVTGVQTCALPISVQRAQNSRANIQRLADKVSNVFVPIVVFIALATGLWWGFAPVTAHRVVDFLGKYLRSEERRVGKECRVWGW